MAKLDYVKTILYGLLLTVLSFAITLVTTMLITKSPKYALVSCIVIPFILLAIYLAVVIKIPEKIGFVTEENQKYWEVKLIYGMSILFYMIISLAIYYMRSQTIGKIMFIATPIFLVIGKVIDLLIKRQQPTQL